MMECLECAAPITAPEDAMKGEILACTECGIEMEITALTPITLGMAPEIEEDWGE